MSVKTTTHFIAGRDTLEAHRIPLSPRLPIHWCLYACGTGRTDSRNRRSDRYPAFSSNADFNDNGIPHCHIDPSQYSDAHCYPPSYAQDASDAHAASPEPSI
jgi:hypothetical protein